MPVTVLCAEDILMSKIGTKFFTLNKLAFLVSSNSYSILEVLWRHRAGQEGQSSGMGLGEVTTVKVTFQQILEKCAGINEANTLGKECFRYGEQPVQEP